DAAPGRKGARQHLAALARLSLTASQMSERKENIVCPHGPILTHLEGRRMPRPDAEAGLISRDQRNADTVLFRPAKQCFRITELEGKAEHSGHRRKRDIALRKIEPYAENFLALPYAAADDPRIRHGGCIRTGSRTCQAEAGNFLARRQA